MTAGISLIPGKTGAHRAPLQLLDPSWWNVPGRPFSGRVYANYEPGKSGGRPWNCRPEFL